MRLIYHGLLVALLASCAVHANPVDVPSRQCKDLSKSYFRQPQTAMLESFGTFDLEKQYTIYLCGNQYIHPPFTMFTKPFAAQGAPVANFLRGKVSTARSDLTVRDIVRAYVEMKRQRTFNARDDAELMQALDARISSMKYEDWKAITRKMYEELAQ